MRDHRRRSVTLPYTSAEAKFRKTSDECFDAMNRYCLRRLPVDEVNDAVVVRCGTLRGEKSSPIGSPLPSFEAKAEWAGRHAHPGPELEIIRASELQHLLDALRSLKPGDRELLLLHTHEELSYAQMAVAFDCSPEAVRKRLSRAMTRLRRAANLPEPHKVALGTRAIEEGGDQ
jgi:RNA polymerase sigma factor (sigma-70 family)